MLTEERRVVEIFCMELCWAALDNCMDWLLLLSAFVHPQGEIDLQPSILMRRRADFFAAVRQAPALG